MIPSFFEKYRPDAEAQASAFAARVRFAWEEQRGTPPSAPAAMGAVEIAPTRNAFLAWLYDSKVVEAAAFSAHASDKLFFARLLELAAPQAYAALHPATHSLAELARAEGDFVAKPVAGMDSAGGRFYGDLDEFRRAFVLDPVSFLGTGGEASPLTGLLSSGERYLLQAKISGGRELRLHTLGARVVAGATYTRWDEPWDRGLFRAAEGAVGAWLAALPPAFVRGQAWALDLVARGDRFYLVEVNTNRGKPGPWSGDLSLPDTLRAYVLHLEEFYGVQFGGAAGALFRAGLANEEKFIGKFGAAALARHRALAAAAGDQP